MKEIKGLRSFNSWTYPTKDTRWKFGIGYGGHWKVPTGKLRTEFHVKRINFIATDGKWHKMEECFDFGRTWVRLKKPLGYDPLVPTEFVLGMIARGVKVYLPPYVGKSVPLLVNTVFYPDPNVETTSVDGNVGLFISAGDTWTNIRGAATGSTVKDSNADEYAIYVKAHTDTNEYDNIWRSFFLFDASSLSGQTATAATLSLYGYALQSNTLVCSDDLSLVSSAPASNTGLATGDYDSLGTTRFATDFPYESWSKTGYNAITINADGITFINTAIGGDGIIKFGVQLSADLDGTEPTWGSGNKVEYYIWFADKADTTNDPKLDVTHEAGASYQPRHGFINFQDPGIV